MSARPVLLAAGGTGGHLFPAEALAGALAARGLAVELATDARAARYAGHFPARALHVLPAETVRARTPLALARTIAILGLGILKGLNLLRRTRPQIVVGFGGYPTLPPLLAASLLSIPTLIHESNGVMGRANRILAGRVSAIATGFAGVTDADPTRAAKTVRTGNPLRPTATAAAAMPFVPPTPGGALHLLVFGGSQGARVMSEVVPAALEQIDPAARARLRLVQQARAEDLPRVRAVYERLGIDAELAEFFQDLPQRMAASHLVIARSGASTVAELSAIGRPSLLVPLPHALDQDQTANARTLERIGAAWLMRQADFTPSALAGHLTRLIDDPRTLTPMANAAKSAGTLDAAERLADLVEHLGAGRPVASFPGKL